ncbi:MAG TPA: PAS domain-containing protein, partial [Paludibacter sp.]
MASGNLHERVEKYLKSKSVESSIGSADRDALLLIKQLIASQSSLEKQNAELILSDAEFHKEREYYKDIFDNQPAGLYRIRVFPTNKWKFRSWHSSDNSPYIMEIATDRFCEILGVMRHDFDKNPFIISDLVHSDDKKSFVKTNEEANKKFIPFRWEGRLLVNENIVWIRLESLPRLLDNGDILWTGILYDMTERKMTEEALNKTRLQLEDVLEGANVGTLEWDVQTGKIKFNKIWARNLGYSSTEIKIGLILYGKNGWKTITHPDDIPYAEEMLQRHFSGELSFHKVEVRMRHKKGHWVWIRQEGKVKTFTEDGKPLLMYGIHTDISKWKQMEEELRANEEKYLVLNEQLQLSNAKINKELELNQKSMTAATLKLIQNAEHDAITIQRLQQIEINTDNEGKKDINALISDYKRSSYHSNWVEFEILFEKVHGSFYGQINTLYPTLTSNERKMCAFLRLNMSNKDIANITFQSDEALK